MLGITTNFLDKASKNSQCHHKSGSKWIKVNVFYVTSLFQMSSSFRCQSKPKTIFSTPNLTEKKWITPLAPDCLKSPWWLQSLPPLGQYVPSVPLEFGHQLWNSKTFKLPSKKSHLKKTSVECQSSQSSMSSDSKGKSKCRKRAKRVPMQ